MRLADAVLFTGAGFSVGLRNGAGEPLPLGHDLKRLLWDLCFPGEAFDETSTLQDLFDLARRSNARDLRDLLYRTFTVTAETIPDYYAAIFSLPWLRVYTLNIDTGPHAVARKYQLPRAPISISAITEGARPHSVDPGRALAIIHLNGVLNDAPDGVTFATTQYADRLTRADSLYIECANDVLLRPCVFIGTPLDESPLWQHMVQRQYRQAAAGEFRRKSFLVTPHIDRARKELLEREFNMVHLAITAEEFVNLLAPIRGAASQEGLDHLRVAARVDAPLMQVPLASSLASVAPPSDSEYLMGRAPEWSDIRGGKAIARAVDDQLSNLVRGLLDVESEPKGVVLLTGTAGSGKSSSALRLALSLSADGIETGWVDPGIEIAPLDIRRSMDRSDHPPLIIIDDADEYGNALADLASDIAGGVDRPLVVLVIRSGRVDRTSDRLSALGVPLKEMVMPHLADDEIDGLIEVLDRENRLGKLKGLPHDEQVKAFREYAGRQLLIAMLSATSGRRFEQRIQDEMDGLDLESRTVYGLVAVATAIRFGLTRDEALLAAQNPTNATLAAMETLQRRHLVVVDSKGEMRVRHRLIAEVLMSNFTSDGSLTPAVTRLGIAAASKVSSATSRNDRRYRRIRTLMNHDWLLRNIGQAAAQRFYADLEPLMRWDHHYWLQRGSIELEAGNIELAENFLNQAYALEPTDPLVETELGYLQLKMALHEPSAEEARRLFSAGTGLLDSAMRARRRSDPHQYQIYGEQGLAWAARHDLTNKERQQVLRDLERIVGEGFELHRRDERLRQLLVRVRNALLGV
jgi:hypothetical protein